MDFLKSKKSKGLIITMVSTLISTYVFKDNPELAENIAKLLVGAGSAYLLSQGAADALGGKDYHNKK